MDPNNIKLHKRNGLYFIKDQYRKRHFLSMKMLIIIMIFMSTN